MLIVNNGQRLFVSLACMLCRKAVVTFGIALNQSPDLGVTSTV